MAEQLKVGFVGLGIMGKPMAKNILKAGFPLTVYNRTESKAQELVDMGATLMHSPAEVARNCDIVVTIVSDTPDVRRVMLGEGGVAEGAHPGLIAIDMSTISPTETRKMAAELAKTGATWLDCPVSGGEEGAIKGTLTIMCGGEKDAYEKAVPVLNAMGAKTTYMGPVGAGQATKLGNQIVGGVTLLAVVEGLLLAQKEGLNLDDFISALSGGSAQSTCLSINGPKIAHHNYEPGFFVELFQKDIRLIMQAAQDDHLTLPGIALVQQFYNTVAGMEGGPKMGHQAMAKALEALNGMTIG